VRDKGGEGREGGKWREQTWGQVQNGHFVKSILYPSKSP
jgi:hypothetical protein